MQNFRTLGLIIKKVRDLFNLSDKYGKIIQCAWGRIEESRRNNSASSFVWEEARERFRIKKLTVNIKAISQHFQN